ncbi:MAG: hypothetical protein MJD61_07150 [Proteobacteria bacterium]|nr:hypothetical protein [Pseudomonadota bacterium]
MLPDPSPLLFVSFVAVVLVVVVALVCGARSAETDAVGKRQATLRAALFLGGWLLLTGGLGLSRVLQDFSMPPKAPMLFLAMMAATVGLGRSRYGAKLATRLPLWFLVGIHVFRLPLELVMHRAHTEGIMPVQMSFSGLNFDIVTGVLAVVCGTLAWRNRLAPGVAKSFNWIGLGLLVNVLVIAIASMPTPLRVFMNEPPNVWVAHFPFIWLPAVLVQTALLSHVLLFRRLASRSGGT